MAMFVSALVLSLSLLVLAGFYHVYQSPQRFPAFAGGRYSEFTAVLSTCLMGQGIAMSVANIGEAASWTYAVAAGMVLVAAFAALRIARLSRPATALPEFEPFKPVTPEHTPPAASNSNKRKVRRGKAA